MQIELDMLSPGVKMLLGRKLYVAEVNRNVVHVNNHIENNQILQTNSANIAASGTAIS